MTSIQVKKEEVRGAAHITLLGIEEARNKAILAEAEHRMKQWFFKPASIEAAIEQVKADEGFNMLYRGQQLTCERLMHMADTSATPLMSLSDHDFDAIRDHMRVV